MSIDPRKGGLDFTDITLTVTPPSAEHLGKALANLEKIGATPEELRLIYDMLTKDVKSSISSSGGKKKS